MPFSYVQFNATLLIIFILVAPFTISCFSLSYTIASLVSFVVVGTCPTARGGAASARAGLIAAGRSCWLQGEADSPRRVELSGVAARRGMRVHYAALRGFCRVVVDGQRDGGPLWDGGERHADADVPRGVLRGRMSPKIALALVAAIRLERGECGCARARGEVGWGGEGGASLRKRPFWQPGGTLQDMLTIPWMPHDQWAVASVLKGPWRERQRGRRALPNTRVTSTFPNLSQGSHHHRAVCFNSQVSGGEWRAPSEVFGTDHAAVRDRWKHVEHNVVTTPPLTPKAAASPTRPARTTAPPRSGAASLLSAVEGGVVAAEGFDAKSRSTPADTRTSNDEGKGGGSSQQDTTESPPQAPPRGSSSSADAEALADEGEGSKCGRRRRSSSGSTTSEGDTPPRRQKPKPKAQNGTAKPNGEGPVAGTAGVATDLGC